MRILLVTPQLGPGSAEWQLVHLVRGLGAAGDSVRVCAVQGGGSLAPAVEPAGGDLILLGRHGRTGIGPWIRLWQEIRAWRPEVIHTFRLAGNALGRLTAALAGRVPIVASAHGPNPQSSAWERLAIRAMHARTSCWIVPSVSEADRWQTMGVRKERIEVVAPAVAEPGPYSADHDGLRASLNLPSKGPVILTGGRLVPHKGFLDAIWSLDILRFIYPDSRLLLVGDGYHRGRLEQFARDLDVWDRVRFLGWRSDMPELLRLADVVWIPSHQDDVSMLALEAMAVGCPVVASRLPALAQIISDGETGLLAPVGDKPAFVRQTRALLEKGAFRTGLIAAAKAYVEAHHGVPEFVGRHRAIYHRCHGPQGA